MMPPEAWPPRASSYAEYHSGEVVRSAAIMHGPDLHRCKTTPSLGEELQVAKFRSQLEAGPM